MSSDTATDYSLYKGKMVDLVIRDESEPDGRKEVTGRIIEGNDLGVIFKAKSQRVQELINTEDILDVSEAVSARLRVVSQKKLKQVGPSVIKRHMADYHGWGRTQLNGMSEVEAMRQHDEIDHSDLGHCHTNEQAAEETRREPRESRDSILERIAKVGQASKISA